MAQTAIFLDRDDTLIEDPGYISRPEQVKLLPDTATALCELRQLGFKLVVISNQSGVARGLFTEEALADIHARMRELLLQQGATVDKIYYCPFHPDGVVEKYRKDSDLRKPNPGMILTAAHDLTIDLSKSWMIGNSYSDVTAGKRAGCRTILITAPGNANRPKPNDRSPDYKANTLGEAVKIIKKLHAPAVHIENSPKIEALPHKTEPKPTPQVEPKQEINTAVQKSAPPVVHETNAAAAVPNKTEQLLEDVLRQLKTSYREDMFTDFSMAKLMAGSLQIVVAFCLMSAVWFLLGTTRNVNGILISLGFAITFQLMALTFYIMHSRK